MLESFFKYRGVLKRMRRGPLAEELDALADYLARTGYARATSRRYLSLVASFSRYAARRGCRHPESIDGALQERFLAGLSASVSVRTLARTALRHVLRLLARRFPQAPEDARGNDPDVPLLTSFDVHLRDVRGLQPRSRDEVIRLARRMLNWHHQHRPDQPLSKLTGEDLLAFVTEISSEEVADATRSERVSHVRNFLRFLRWEGMLQEDLARLVPRVPCWRQSRGPAHLSWPEVRRVIDAIESSDPVGKRDRALLLLLATTGLRNQELRRLELRDVRWRTGDLHVRRTKGRRERLVPLVEEAGRALAEYIVHGRPQVREATVFLRHVPPVGPLACSATLSAIIRRRPWRVGIRPSWAGAHLIRHSLATRMVQQARPVKEIADLLGHRRIDTTAVYVKVALPQLEDVALPFPRVDT